MLESMIELSVPTRAEVSDVANAILDGTDAVMLSAESAMGKHPMEAVKMLRRVAERTEKDYNHRRMYFRIVNHEGIKDGLSEAVISASRDSGAKLIFAFTESGGSARLIGRYRPVQDIICFCPNEAIFRGLNLSFGCNPVLIPRFKTLDEAWSFASDYALKNSLAAKGDKVLVSAGTPFNQGEGTNEIIVKTLE
jgi:pyruvate kinase